MNTSEKIRMYRRARGYSQEELGELVGVKKAAINKYETGRVVNIKRSTLMKLADALKVPPAELLDDVDYDFDFIVKTEDHGTLLLDHAAVKKRVAAIRIPVLGRVQAGIPIDAQEEILDWEEITPNMALSGDYFALQVKGDSMEPKFSEGDVVIVRQQDDAESGDIVIAMVNGNDATIKRLMKYENGGIALVASNPMYPPMHFSEQEIMEMSVAIIGKVVELRAKF